MRRFCSILFLLVIIFACTPITEPTFERIANVEVLDVSTKQLRVNADMILMNNNSFALDLSSAEIKVIVDDIELADFVQNFDTSMPAKSEFEMPMEIEMKLERLYDRDPLGALTKGLKILSEKKLDVQFLGKIHVGKGMTKIPVAIDRMETIVF